MGNKTLLVCIAVIIFIFEISLVYASTEDEFLNILNQERTMLGKQNLSDNLQLQEAGFLHSKDMIDNDYFSHTSLDGRTFTQRITNAGYLNYIALGENIAYHSGNPNASILFDMWKGSSGHYSNMISSSFSEMGLGVYTGDYKGSQVTMYTLDLGKRNTPACTSGENESRECGSDVGECIKGIQNRTCINEQWAAWSECFDSIGPSQEVCDSLDNDCDGSADESLDCIELEASVNHPENGSLFFSSSVVFNITVNKKVKNINITDNGKRVYYCSNCGSISRNLYLNSGIHETVISIQEYNLKVSYFNVSFRVYLPSLSISSIYPSSSYIIFGKDSNFSITYTSKVPVKGKAIVNSSGYNAVLENNCTNGTRVKCSFMPELPENLSEKANVTFVLEDEFGFKAEKRGSASIDTKAPNITANITKTISSLRKTYKIKGVLNEYSKAEYALEDAAYSQICSSCKTFYKYVTMYVSEPAKEAHFRITDKAGNSIEDGYVLD